MNWFGIEPGQPKWEAGRVLGNTVTMFVISQGGCHFCVELRRLASEEIFCFIGLVKVSDDQHINPEKAIVKRTKKLVLKNLQNLTSRSQTVCPVNTLGSGE
jgi:hypothetical protein